ncbi:MAG: F0F1 ATP synthase subunit delta [Anaerovoracaceae bacterium]|jgi:F-type H+-transporting ATPase subunit delta
MAELTVDMTYGNALFQAAKDLGRVDEMHEEAEAVLDVFLQEKDFYRLLCNPTVSNEEKKTILKNVFEGRISKEMLSFLYILVDNNRGGHYERIVREYRKLRDEEEGFETGTVYSVQPLTEEQMARLQEETSDLLKRRIKLENLTDKSLIGGFKVMVGGKMIDASLKKRLADLGAALNS